MAEDKGMPEAGLGQAETGKSHEKGKGRSSWMRMAKIALPWKSRRQGHERPAEREQQESIPRHEPRSDDGCKDLKTGNNDSVEVVGPKEQTEPEHDNGSEQMAARITDLTERLNMRDAQILERDETITQQTATIKGLQHQAKGFKNGDIGTSSGPSLTKWHAPKEDGAVRDALSKLVDRVRGWARSHSVASYSDLDHVPAGEKNTVLDALNECCAVDGWEAMRMKMAGAILQDKIPAVLVQALLAKDLFGRFFTNPFFAFANGQTGVSLFPPGSNKMQILWQAMASSVGKAQAHVWRSDTIRNLSNGPHAFLPARLEPRYAELAESFVKGPAHTLLRPAVADKSIQELRDIYKGAALLALSLWSQRVSMSCRTRRDLPAFNIGDEMMTAHRLHHLDEEDASLDGAGVLLVVQPAILAFGSEAADHYDQHKVWMPATVVLDVGSVNK